MRANSSLTCLVVGLGLFAVVTLIWLLFPMLSDGGAAAQMAVPGGLFSRLVPNYGSDDLGAVFRTLRLTIIREIIGDGLEQQLLRPVPTATWRDFAGAAPYTATPTHTPTSTNTPTPTSTATPTHTATPRPTRTRTPTEKPEEQPPPPPTNTPTITPTPSDTPTPTNTPTPIPDVAGPDVILVRIVGTHESPTCMFTIEFGVEDPKPSAGVENSQVHLFYEYPIGSGDKEAGLSGGGDWVPEVPGEKWVGTYTGQIFGVSTGDRFKFRVEVEDNAGHPSLPSGFTFDVDADCAAIDV